VKEEKEEEELIQETRVQRALNDMPSYMYQALNGGQHISTFYIAHPKAEVTLIVSHGNALAGELLRASTRPTLNVLVILLLRMHVCMSIQP
jgi:hypothetical protein